VVSFKILGLTVYSDRCEVEWKYLLKLDPEESQRPKPSANAKPLPEHLKENDASLDMSNRTDGVPEMGDPFLDPNSEHKWAEFNTAPAVTRRCAKVDLGKENRLWFYLGKTSTEARPQYTENITRPQHNPKSNFLDTVRPPPPAIQTFQHRTYPATYPIKPAPLAMPPRTPVQESMRPYAYKPKESMIHTTAIGRQGLNMDSLLTRQATIIKDTSREAMCHMFRHRALLRIGGPNLPLLVRT
jgi:hypothetical protein